MMLKLSFLLTTIHIVMSGTINDTAHPNVIIMHVNNLNWNDLGIHVNRVDNENSTPNIDRLAYAGIILNRFYANGGSDSLYSGCYRRSSYGNPNLMSTYFERNGYHVNILSSKNFTKLETFFKTITNSISNNSQPFYVSVDFGYVGYDIKIPALDDIVGRIITTLHDHDILNDTIIIFLSLPTEHAYEATVSPIEINIRRTAIIYSKLLSHPQSISNQLIHISDILPTLVDAAHLVWRTKDLILMDGISQWQVINTNDKTERTSIFGDNFYIQNNLKLTYGIAASVTYDSINNQYMESAKDDNFDFNTYIQSITSSDIYNLFTEKLTVNKIMLLRNRARVHCNMNDVNESIVNNIKCTRAAPCLFDLQADPCEFDDMHEHEYDLKKDRMMRIFERYLNNGIVRALSNGSDEKHPTIDGHHKNSTDSDGDPIMTPSGGLNAVIVLGITLAVFLVIFVIVVCVKERCNSRRSVYVDKSKKVTFKDESGMNSNGISSISASIQSRENNTH